MDGWMDGLFLIKTGLIQIKFKGGVDVWTCLTKIIVRWPHRETVYRIFWKNKWNPLPPSLRRPLRTSCCPAVGLLDAGSSRPWPELSEGLASDRSFTHDHQLTSATHSPTTTQVLTVYKILLRKTEAVHDLEKTAGHGWDVSGGE